MKYILRDYQEKSVKHGVEFFKSKSKKNSVLVLPTGSGKSLIIANIAKNLEGNTVIFQPSKELLQQNYEKYTSYGEFAEIYSASANRKKISKVTFATIGSVVNKPELFNNFQNCIIDECHLVSPDKTTMYQKFFDTLNLKVLGLTATPIRMKRYNYPYPHVKLNMLNRMRPRFFSEYLYIVQISEMINNNYFAKIEYNIFDFDNSKLITNSTGGDYTEKSIKDALKSNSAIERICKVSQGLINKNTVKHILIFAPSTDEAYAIEKELKIKSATVTANTHKKERTKILESFKIGQIKIVINVGVLTTGFDFPELDCIISARPTRSLALYYQIIGRSVRPHPSKQIARFYDFVGNYERFGKVEDLVIEKINNNWVIHNGKNILTNTNLDEIEESSISEIPKMTFGKYSGKKLDELPKGYVEWFLKKVEKNKYNSFIFEYFNNL